MYPNQPFLDYSPNLKTDMSPEFQPLKIESLHINFTLSLIQSFLVISLSQLSDQTIVSFIHMRSITNTPTAFLSCSISSILLILLFLAAGYGISLLLPYELISAFSIFIFLFASIYLIIKSHQCQGQTFDDDLHQRKHKDKPKNDFKRQLSVIPENREDSKTVEDVGLPLIEKTDTNGYSLDQKEEIDDLINFHIVIESIEKKLLTEWLNKTYLLAFVIAMLYDFSAVVPGVICSIMFELAIGDIFWNELIRFISVKLVDRLLAALLAIYGVQIYFMK